MAWSSWREATLPIQLRPYLIWERTDLSLAGDNVLPFEEDPIREQILTESSLQQIAELISRPGKVVGSEELSRQIAIDVHQVPSERLCGIAIGASGGNENNVSTITTNLANQFLAGEPRFAGYRYRNAVTTPTYHAAAMPSALATCLILAFAIGVGGILAWQMPLPTENETFRSITEIRKRLLIPIVGQIGRATHPSPGFSRRRFTQSATLCSEAAIGLILAVALVAALTDPPKAAPLAQGPAYGVFSGHWQYR